MPIAATARFRAQHRHRIQTPILMRMLFEISCWQEAPTDQGDPSRRPVSVHTAWCLLLKRQGHQAKGMATPFENSWQAAGVYGRPRTCGTCVCSASGAKHETKVATYVQLARGEGVKGPGGGDGGDGGDRGDGVIPGTSHHGPMKPLYNFCMLPVVGIAHTM